MKRWWLNWRERHRHPVSFGLHIVAIPLLPVAGWLVMVQLMQGAWSLWWRPVGLFALSYLLQWIGHVIEGNDMGEVILIKKLMGKPYIAVAIKRDGRPNPSPSKGGAWGEPWSRGK